MKEKKDSLCSRARRVAQYLLVEESTRAFFSPSFTRKSFVGVLTIVHRARQPEGIVGAHLDE